MRTKEGRTWKVKLLNMEAWFTSEESEHDSTLYNRVCQWLGASLCYWLLSGYSVSYTKNKVDVNPIIMWSKVNSSQTVVGLMYIKGTIVLQINI
jgi:hypothetical protein